MDKTSVTVHEIQSCGYLGRAIDSGVSKAT